MNNAFGLRASDLRVGDTCHVVGYTKPDGQFTVKAINDGADTKGKYRMIDVVWADGGEATLEVSVFRRAVAFCVDLAEGDDRRALFSH